VKNTHRYPQSHLGNSRRHCRDERNDEQQKKDRIAIGAASGSSCCSCCPKAAAKAQLLFRLARFGAALIRLRLMLFVVVVV
jgi:hypothetical protein